MILLNPGPVNITERVRSALTKADLCHRESEFISLQNSVRKNLLKVYNLNNETWGPALITGSGTAAVEAMLISMIPTRSKLLIIENGVYGERMKKIASAYSLPHDSLKYDWTEEIDIEQVESTLKTNKFTHLAVVHHETTTGRLNNLAAISKICAQTKTKLLVDAVSSFGAEEINFSEEKTPLSACAATSNKCLHSSPGISFVLLNRSDLKKNIPKRSVYLDLKHYLSAQDNNSTPFTQSVQSLYALDEALRELLECGGWLKRNNIYKERMRDVSIHLESLGLSTLLPDDSYSLVLKSFIMPASKNYDDLHSFLKKNGFVIYAGQGPYQKQIFRISLMGQITEGDISRFKKTITDFFS